MDANELKNLTTEMVKGYSNEELRLLNTEIIDFNKGKNISQNHIDILDMIDARFYPNSYRVGC